jgi:GNAT superfamily N-acetyltransferase
MVAKSLLEQFDRQARCDVVGAHVERTERSTLFVGDGWSAVLWTDLDEETADAEIARLVPRLRGLPGHAEWKLYGHDRPPDLAERLVAAGLTPEDEEVVLVAPLAGLDLDVPVDADVRVATDAAGIAAFVDVNERVFGERYSDIGRELERALEEDPPSMLAVLCFAGGAPVSAARIDFNAESEFAGLYGGATVAEWRGRGLYRATVAKRAQLARERGYRYLFVDALPTSRPILERLGFVQITTTTPFV